MRSEAIATVRAFSVSASPGTRWTLAEVVDADGFRGLGEAASEDHAELEAQIRRMGAAMLGKTVAVRDGDGPAGSIISATQLRATSAIDQAIWDLRAQREGTVLAAALGKPRRFAIRTYANLNRGQVDRDPAASGRCAAAAVASGFRVLKIAPFDGVTVANCATAPGQASIEVGMARVAAVRDAGGHASELLVDCHWRFDERTASAVIERLARHSVSWVECPIPETRDSLATLARLRQRANDFGIRLAGADEIDDAGFFRDIIAAHAYDVVMPDVKHLGGLLPTLQLVELAERNDVLCSLHNPTGPVAHLHSVHLSALMQSDLYLEFPFLEAARHASVMNVNPAIPVDGWATLPAAAGLGASLSPAFARTLSCGQQSVPHSDEPTTTIPRSTA